MTEDDEITNIENGTAEYFENDIITLSWNEHIQRRPGMYIGKTGDGTNSDDGIYVLIKEVIDNSIDEYMMGFGKVIGSDCRCNHRNRTRLWSRNSSGLAYRGGIKDEYRRQIRL